ncbi:MAG: enoyl-CoA hydratase/isomerase family protein [Bacteroidia bacterium]|nr:enoyl-CoA hydratase/isomerase family protein [Bacteroidia bacterium]
MTKRIIKKVAVLGSGVMGSRIACHFANAGVQVLLLDIVPDGAAGNERNKLVNDALSNALKSNPSPLYRKVDAQLIATGNFSDDMKRIADADWIIEVVVENLDIKRKVFDEVEKYRKPGSLISSNTSGIPISMMNDGRSEDFKRHFCGTHFFNPPRYLPLLEIIPGPDTLTEVVDFYMSYGERVLGKTTVLCKDTPAFIANRIGVFGIMTVFQLLSELQLSITDIDKLTGPVIGRPKSATFRTSDVVGLDTLLHVAAGLRANLPNDEARKVFEVPAFIQKMADNRWLGDKSGQGFYKKVKNPDGKSEILVLNPATLEYTAQTKSKFPLLDQVKVIEKLPEKLKVLYAGDGKAGSFYRKQFNLLFAYVSHRIPEISDEIYRIDEAMKAGFGWELGPFETWDALGLEQSIRVMETDGIKPASWVMDMLKAGKKSFYQTQNGRQTCFDPASNTYKPIPGIENLIILKHQEPNAIVWQNKGATIYDIGDGVLNLEFHTKMNSVDSNVLSGVQKAIDLAERDFKGVLIANEAPNFSAGANLAMVFMMAVEQDWDEIDFSIRAFQQTVMRIRYSSIPVVTATRGMTLGGGCEMTLHADKVVAAAESYIGLVEFGVGLIPGGGGSKEFALRASDEFKEGDILLPVLKERFLTIGQAKVSTSAEEAFDMGILRKGNDRKVMNGKHLISEGKREVLNLADAGYQMPVPRKDIRVLGRTGLGMVYAGAHSMYSGQYISEHDKKISEKLGFVLCGGDLSAPTLVSEQYLLDLEREAFLSLCGEKKTLERIQSLLTTGKILRN